MRPNELEGTRIAVTGASGFIGRWVVNELAGRGASVFGCTRRIEAVHAPDKSVQWRVVSDLTDAMGWSSAFQGCNIVIHLAGRAHVTDEDPERALELHRAVNLGGTRTVATAAAFAGVRRLIFLSSIGVLGPRSRPGSPLRAGDDPNPATPYARSKLEAETFLHEFGRREGLGVTCVRPPMVYGPGAPGNLRALTRALRGRWPLPLGAIQNRRAFIGVNSLADLLASCACCDSVSGMSLHVSDGYDVSTTDFVCALRTATNGRAPLLPVPPRLIRTVLRQMGRQHVATSLLDNLEVDISETLAATAWKPRWNMNEAMHRMYLGHA